MAKTSNLYARIEPEVKEQAEGMIPKAVTGRFQVKMLESQMEKNSAFTSANPLAPISFSREIN